MNDLNRLVYDRHPDERLRPVIVGKEVLDIITGGNPAQTAPVISIVETTLQSAGTPAKSEPYFIKSDVTPGDIAAAVKANWK